MTARSLEVDEQEARALRLQAEREGVSVPELLRRGVRLSPASPAKPGTVHCPHTGARIFADSEVLPPITTNAVRELLRDFP